MKTALLTLSLIFFSAGLRADIYKCSNGEFVNTTGDRGPEQLIARGCKRMAMKTDPVSVNGREQITIPVSNDGHFRLKGEINGRPILFIVDTGASAVSVSREFATFANLVGGEPISLNTANGKLSGRLLKNIQVMAGGFTLPSVDIAVGLTGGDPNVALLGQSFLAKFEMTLDDRQMILRNKKQ